MASAAVIENLVRHCTSTSLILVATQLLETAVHAGIAWHTKPNLHDASDSQLLLRKFICS